MYDSVLKYFLTCTLHNTLSVTVVITASSSKLPRRKIWISAVDRCVFEVLFITVSVRTTINTSSKVYTLRDADKFTHVIQLPKCNMFHEVIARYMCTCTHIYIYICIYVCVCVCVCV
jgi:hypothetical protein